MSSGPLLGKKDRGRSSNMLRWLDVDDLIIMELMLNGATKAKIAKILNVTPAAISHRLCKHESVFRCSLFDINRGVRGSVNEDGIKHYTKGVQALKALCGDI